MNKSLLEYLKIENISHPAQSDVEIGMKTCEQESAIISKFISKVFVNEAVNFSCKNNGIESCIVIQSKNKKMQLTFESSVGIISYIITDTNDLLLETVKEKTFNKKYILKKKLIEYGEKEGWVKK